MSEPPKRPRQDVTVFDVTNNRDERVPAEEATAGFREGRYRVRPGEVDVLAPDGTPGTIDASELQQLVEAGGRIASPDDAAQAQYERENEGAAGALRVAGEGAVRAIPFVGEPLLEAAGDSAEEQWRGQRAHPYIGMGGEIASIAAQIALTRGAGAGAGTARLAELAELAEGARAAETTAWGARAGEALYAGREAQQAARAGETVAALDANIPLVTPTPGVATVAHGIPAAERATAAAPGVDFVPAVREAVAPGSADAVATMPGRAGVVAPEELFLSEDQIGTRAFGASRTAEAPIPVRTGRHEAATGAVTVPEQQALDAFDAVQAASEEFPGQRAAIAAQESMSEIAPQGPALREFPQLAPSQGNEIVGGIATRPGMGRVEMPIVTAEMLAPARTAAIEAGVPVLGREALAVEEAMVAGNRAGFADVLRNVAQYHPYNLSESLGVADAFGAGRAGRAAGAAASGALEGGIYGASNYVNQSMLEDQPLTAEGLAMAVGEGALFGGGANLALHGVGGLVGAGRRASAAAAERFSPSFAAAMREGNVLRYAADRSAVSALQPRGSSLEKLGNRFVRNADGVAERGGMGNVLGVGRMLNAEGIMQGAPGLETIATRLGEMNQRTGQAIGSMARQSAERGALVDLGRLRSGVNDIARGLESTGLRSSEVLGSKVRREFAAALAGERMTAVELHELRQAVDQQLRNSWGQAAGQAQSPIVDQLKAMRRLMEDELEATIARSGNDLAAAYKPAKQLYGQGIWAEREARHAMAANMATRNSPLASLVSGAGAASIFGGVSPQALAVGFLTGSVHRWVKEHGAALAASGLSAVLKAGALNRVANVVRNNAVRSVKDAFATAARAGVVRMAAQRPLSDKQFQTTATSLYALSHDPEASLAAGAALAPIQQSAPSAGLAAQQVQAARLQYLANLIPGAQAPDSLSALVAIRSATPAQVAQFGKAFAIAQDPSVYLQSFADHTITAETTAHMRALWPATFGTMLQTLQSELETRNEPLSPAMRRTVAVMLGQQPVDQSPAYIMLMQANYGTQATQGGQPQAASGAPAIDNVAERSMTGPQATEARIAAGGPGS
jgi:hypothetical protein